ncbi:hypothetical protein [Inquilinus limosus]|uniref:Uncharacterized protein n=1 Tax=Inquilinus limosus MP06 TaxID=1398085 RepID=A0A0A0DCU0_9PROT|nr:hypothetical protein [Inquilinus limosus]KGM35929.1 hypothetical protein P409_01425 [Inquilinus limosus MP06]
MSLIGTTGVEPDDTVAQSGGWCLSKSESRSAYVSWSEVAVAWVAIPAVLGIIAAIVAALS